MQRSTIMAFCCRHQASEAVEEQEVRPAARQAASPVASRAHAPGPTAAADVTSEEESSGLEPSGSEPSGQLGMQLWQIQQQRAQQLQAEESGPEARARLRKSYPAG